MSDSKVKVPKRCQNCDQSAASNGEFSLVVLGRPFFASCYICRECFNGIETVYCAKCHTYVEGEEGLKCKCGKIQ